MGTIVEPSNMDQGIKEIESAKIKLTVTASKESVELVQRLLSNHFHDQDHSFLGDSMREKSSKAAMEFGFKELAEEMKTDMQ